MKTLFGRYNNIIGWYETKCKQIISRLHIFLLYLNTVYIFYKMWYLREFSEIMFVNKLFSWVSHFHSGS